jgi:transposase
LIFPRKSGHEDKEIVRSSASCIIPLRRKIMARNKRSYTREFKIEAVRLVRTSGKTQAEIAEELGIPESNLTRWKKKYGKDGEVAFPGHGRLTPEKERLRQLERENEILRQERDILKKAVTIFSQPSK